MEWTELLLEINVEDIETASNIACMVVPYGFYIEDYSDLEQGAREIAHIDLIDEELIEKDRSKAIIHIYISPEENPAEAVDYLKVRLEEENIDYLVSTSGISEEDWANNWKQFFKPTPVGEKLFILPEWEPQVETDRKIIHIDPGAAFGTGTHATTRLCMEALEKHIKSGDDVLDIGCGSGILSIAAMLVGANSVTGVDIDPLAVKTARENGLKNNMQEPEYTMIQGDLADKITAKYDVCLANIVADVIIRLCDNISDYLKDGGYFITSGIIDVREDEVVDAILGIGFEIVERYECGGWVCMVAKKK
ncbi:MAG: 50S ribosomal protein L11 methyltransferase [Clostridia bacterium]|nr:50S ribosomal protein L11 methyltransferase [Clostridia bacterium]